MPYVADSSELLTAADNGIITFHQLPGVNHTGNIGPVTGLQIPWIVPIGIILVLTLTLVQLALLLLESVFAIIPPGYNNSNLPISINI